MHGQGGCPMERQDAWCLDGAGTEQASSAGPGQPQPVLLPALRKLASMLEAMALASSVLPAGQSGEAGRQIRMMDDGCMGPR